MGLGWGWGRGGKEADRNRQEEGRSLKIKFSMPEAGLSGVDHGPPTPGWEGHRNKADAISFKTVWAF